MASQRLFGPNQPFRLVENHHFLSNAKNNQVESVDIAKHGVAHEVQLSGARIHLPLYCRTIWLKLSLFGGDIEHIAIL
jgi:hypothetical protein